MKEENNKKKKIIIICVVAVLVLLTALILFLYNRSKISATTMRILRLEGEVTLTDDGKDKPVKENLRLNRGNALSTAIQSLVSIGLDDVKIVTLDEKSRAEFNQDGRDLDLELTAGSLFFEVQKPLEDDETMDIRTSTMIVGIRGTSGWVSVDGEHEQLIVTDGVVHVTGRNPVTGEVKEIDVHAGERITVYLYNDRKVDSIEFILEKITERELPEFVLERLRENRTLLDKVCRETGWDKPWILGETTDEIPKVIIDDNESTGDDDNVSDVTDDADETEEMLEDIGQPDTGNVGASAEERAWAMSKVVAIDPESHIMALVDNTLFDPVFYAATNPDVVAKYGKDADSLLVHYLKYGKREGRPPIAPITLTPTPTLAPTGGKKQNTEEEEGNHDSGKKNGSTNNVLNSVMNDGDTATFSGQYGKGAKARLYGASANNPNGRADVISPDQGNNTTATIPEFGVYNSQAGQYNHYPVNLGNGGNVNIDWSNNALNNLNTLDLSSATRTTGGNVEASDMLSYLSDSSKTNNGQLTTIKGPASNLTRTSNTTPPTFEAEVKPGAPGSQSVSDLKEYVNNMATNTPNGVTKTTYPGNNGGQNLEVTLNNNTTTANVNNRNYTDIQIDQNNNVTGIAPNSTVRTTIGTVDSNGFNP